MQHIDKLQIDSDMRLAIKPFIKEYTDKKGLKSIVKNYHKNLRNPSNARELITTLDNSFILTNDTDLSNVRELLVVEVQSEHITGQAGKMMNLINYLATINLYHQAKLDGKLDFVKRVENWTPHFISICENYNMNFTGIVLVLGGPSGMKNVHNEFTNMKGNFKNTFALHIAKLTENISILEASTDYIVYKWKKELEFKLGLKFDFELVLPSGYRYMEE
jgi:hypothetical protein